MICPTCGTPNEDGVLFCEKCKSDLDPPTVRTQRPVPPPMNDSPSDPIPLEPIALEPISLEPVAPGAALLEEAPPITLEPADETVEDRPGPPPLPLESTGDLPVVPVAGPEVLTPVPKTSPKLIVLRGQRMDVVYPLYPGKNYLGRTDDKPVDIDLEDQEASDRIWTSRQHAVINHENGGLTIEDLNSLNGTFVNRARVHPGQLKELRENDVIQVGTVHMKVVLG